MPLHLDDDLTKTGGTGFDLQSATTLFWKPVPVIVRHSDREDQNEDLTCRILTGHARHNHNLRVGGITMRASTHTHTMHSGDYILLAADSEDTHV